MLCGVLVALVSMHNHVAIHFQKGDLVSESSLPGEAEPCSLCAHNRDLYYEYGVQDIWQPTAGAQEKKNISCACRISGCNAIP